VLHGSSPDVGVVGYTLGGGLGWLARSRGLAANSVTAVELVTAEGRLVRADREHEPDLFWALRGGGGSFGVVTAIELELFPAPELDAGALFWPSERAAEVLQAWRAWADTVPDELTSLGRILHLPPLPAILEPLRGGGFVVVEAVFAGPGREGAELLRPLRRLRPRLDTFAAVAPTALQDLHMDPPEPVPGVGDGLALDDLTEGAIDAVVTTGVPPLLSLRQLGGALAAPSAGHGAIGSLSAGYAMFAVGFAPTPELGAAVDAALDRAKAALAPWQSERTCFNFAERGVDPARLYPRETYRRLRRVKAAYDPGEPSSPTTRSPRSASGAAAGGFDPGRSGPPLRRQSVSDCRPVRSARSTQARAIARSWIASPVESNAVSSSGDRRPGASPASTAPSWVTFARPSRPAATARARSPEWLACSQSSQKTRVRASSGAAISALPGPSAPIRLTC
jgi:hypothetical protein